MQPTDAAHGEPPDVRALVERYLRHVDRTLPGRIEGLYLVGSLALGDYWRGRSDVDFVAVTGEPFRPEELAGLEVVHAVLRRHQRRPDFSGIYVTWDDLQRDPAEIERVPYHLGGRFGRSGGFDANPAIWLTLRRYPYCVRGPERPVVWHDPAVVRRWSHGNLTSYWSRWAWRHRRLWGRGAYLLADGAIAWCVPGVTRLHYTISTGDITSKAGACRWALATFPAHWHPVLREALAIRTGKRVRGRSRLARRRDALAYMRFVIADANRSAVAAGLPR